MTGKKHRKNTHKSPLQRVLLYLMLLMLGLVAVCAIRSPRLSGTETSREASLQDTLTFAVLDVGQGEAILIRCGDHAMMYDGGPRDRSSFVVAWLKEQGITRLDYLVSSHYDADHLYGLIGCLAALEVEEVLDGDYEKDSEAYTDFQKYVKDSGAAVVHPGVGDVFSLGEASFTVVCPDNYEAEDDNENSIGIRITFGDTSFLVCGDADTAVEETMVRRFGKRLRSDVLVCSHHGSTYSTSEEFLDRVQPVWAVISCGQENDYGHPHQRVMELLQDRGILLFRTDLQQTVIASSDGQTITWNRDPTEDYSDGWKD